MQNLHGETFHPKDIRKTDAWAGLLASGSIY